MPYATYVEENVFTLFQAYSRVSISYDQQHNLFHFLRFMKRNLLDLIHNPSEEGKAAIRIIPTKTEESFSLIDTN